MGDMVQTWGLLWDGWGGSFTVNVMQGGGGSHTYSTLNKCDSQSCVLYKQVVMLVYGLGKHDDVCTFISNIIFTLT